ncbi:two-component system phosphate regulon response regulator PhoB [Rhizobium sp. BK529]|uniref:winged helix-turn-helix transcriptional regulator n=1 Tax=Rhizobium sp. BK529 TaxID=2586983 RepID=UPI00160B6AE4|nr:response regulator transcription factor [Rhizobium sp. BK529]MBB3594812.1 two-component system phosphate regulon response regulator PhoB [Rhizobium sp. BK529]
MKPNIVISSLDADFSLTLRHILEVEGFSTDLAMSPAETVDAIRQKQNVGLVLDGRNEFAINLCRSLKSDAGTGQVRIVALVPKEAEHRYEAFLNAGVDEIFIRPIEPERYLRALKRLLGGNGHRSCTHREQEAITYGGLTVDTRAHRITYDGRDIHLGPIEFALLRTMTSEPTRVFRRDELAFRAWPQGVFVDPKTVNVHIGRLRKALLAVMTRDIIRTVRGIGYGIEFDGD